MPTLDYRPAPSETEEGSTLASFLLVALPVVATVLTPLHVLYWRHEPFGNFRLADALVLVGLPASLIAMLVTWLVLMVRQRVMGCVVMLISCWWVLLLVLAQHSIVRYLFQEPWTG